MAEIAKRITITIIKTKLSFSSVWDSFRVFRRVLFLIILISIFVMINATASARTDARYSVIAWGSTVTVA